MEITTKPPRRLRILLAASLGLNLLFVGLVAGAVWRGAEGPRGPDGPRMARAQDYAAPYLHALGRDERRALRKELRAQLPDIGPRARRTRYNALIAAVQAVPFDAAQVEAVLHQQAQLGRAVQEAGQNALIARISRMTDAERAAYAARLQERLDRAPRRRPKLLD